MKAVRLCTGVALLLLVLLPVLVDAQSLVAYYSWDSSPQLLPQSGICPRRSDLGNATLQGSTLPTFVSSTASFGQAISVGGQNYADGGNWQIGSVLNQLSISLWFRFNPSPQSTTMIISKTSNSGSPNSYSWSLGTTNVTVGGTYVTLQFRLRFGATTTLLRSFTIDALSANTWYHGAGTFDGTRMRVYINGVEKNSVSVAGTINENADKVVIGNACCDYTSRYFSGYIDEIKVYDYALSGDQVLADAQATQILETPTVSLPSALTTTVSDGIILTPTYAGNNLQFKWFQTAGGCNTATLSNDTQPTVNITFFILNVFTFQLLVSNGQLCDIATTDITVSGNPVVFDSSTIFPSVIIVPEGGVGQFQVSATGNPAPSYQWQAFLEVGLKPFGNGSSSTRRSLTDDYQWEDYQDTIQHGSEFAWRALPPCAADNSTNCTDFEWDDIPGQTNSLFTTRGTTAIDNVMIRVLAFNYLGVAISPNMTLRLGEDSSSSDSSSDSLGAIIGGVVGGVALCCILACLIIAILLAILLIRRRRAAGGFTVVEPDYDEVIFGTWLQQGYKVKKKHRGGLERLEELLCSDPDLNLAELLSTHCRGQQDDMARSMLFLFHARQKAGDLMNSYIDSEVYECQSEGTLMRANTFAPKLFKYYAILFGSPYLFSTMAYFAHQINHEAKMLENEEDIESGGSSSGSRKLSSLVATHMEVDPTRLDEAADPKVNTLQLWLTAQKIFSAISRSTNNLPQQIIEALTEVHQRVADKYPGQEYKAIGGFYFLRWVCAALTTPHHFGLLPEPPNPTAQRQFILIGKVLQNLANDTLPGSKEEYMVRLNEFITTNKEELVQFYDRLLAAHNPPSHITIPDVVRENALCFIYEFIRERYGKLKPELSNVTNGDELIKELEDMLLAGQIEANEH